MKPYLLSALFFIFLAPSAIAQHHAVRDTAKPRRNYNGIHGTDYISLGAGKYSNVSATRPAMSIALLAEYRYHHLYANAGLGGYLMTADVPESNLYGSLTQTSRFLLALPMGAGFITTNKKRITIQLGADIPCLSEISFNAKERGFAIAPRLSVTKDLRKRKRAVGAMIHGLFNIQEHNPASYNPTYIGLALFARYY